MKRTLIIHPEDKSTLFLTQIYESIKKKSIIKGNITKDELRIIIPGYDRIIMCGHGTPMGLMSVGQFGADTRGYIIDESFVPVLRGKECIFIWCNSDRFVEFHKLKGFYTGMFVSEYGEADYCGIRYVKKGQVEESNGAFAAIMKTHINKSPKVILKSVLRSYGVLGEVNPVAAYNNSRLYLSE